MSSEAVLRLCTIETGSRKKIIRVLKPSRNLIQPRQEIKAWLSEDLDGSQVDLDLDHLKKTRDKLS